MTKECNCDLRTKLVGDGCAVCNPELTIEYMSDEIADLKQERDELAAQVEVMREALRAQESAEKYAKQYRHLPDAADEIADAFECARAKRLQALTTPSEALREVEARVLEEAASKYPQFSGVLLSMAAAKRKGE